mgnify:CR=1 FL=1
MFLAQGMVIEKITGKSWEENVRETISHLLHAVPFFPVFNSGRVNVVCTDLSEGWDNTVASRRRGGTSRRKNGERLRDM